MTTVKLYEWHHETIFRDTTGIEVIFHTVAHSLLRLNVYAGFFHGQSNLLRTIRHTGGNITEADRHYCPT